MGRQVPLLTANAYRREEIKQLGGVDEVIFSHFDEQMQHMDWRDFIHKGADRAVPCGWIISGRNNRFGYKGQGNAEGMAVECAKAGIGYDCIDDVKMDGIVVSSTYIRQLIAQGDMERPRRSSSVIRYTVTGIVEHGRTRRHERAWRTDGQSAPAGLKWRCRRTACTRRACSWTGKATSRRPISASSRRFWTAARRPSSRICSTFAGDLYGRMIHVELHKFLRPEMQFESVEALKNAIDENVRQTRELFAER